MLQDVNTGGLSSYSPSEIQPGGTLHLGGRDKHYVGIISHFNVWSYVLPMQIITMVSQQCWVERGDVISWESFKNGLPGNVKVIKDVCPSQGISSVDKIYHIRSR
jgi:hypothetical protein